MTTSYLSDDATDQTVATLFALVARERLARDTNDWTGLGACYWPGANVRVTWFDGSAEEFIDRSRESVRPGKVSGFHEIVPVRARVAGARALIESRGMVLLRPRVNGVECDLASWCRFVGGAEQRDGKWRLSFFDNIYVKDRIDPVIPGTRVAVDEELLAGFRPSYRWLSYTNQARGIPVPQDLPGDDRPELVAEFWQDKMRWIAEAP